MKGLNNKFQEKLGVSGQLMQHPRYDNRIGELRISGWVRTMKILDWIYKDATIYLERKYNRYVEMKKLYQERLKSRWSHLITIEKK